jgi:hypothetical protein
MARTRLNRQQIACGLLAVVMSVLSFAGVLQAGRWRLPGAGGTDERAHASLNVWLVDQVATGDVRQHASNNPAGMASVAMHRVVDASTAQPRAGGTLMAYVPVAELSERPLLVQDIDGLLDLASAGIADPDWRPAQQVVAILLISEQGSVDQLRFEESVVPRYLESVLAQRFSHARFLPGKIDGRPVPSALRIALQWQ